MTTTSLELSKKLKAAGVPQDSALCWGPEIGEESAPIILRDWSSKVKDQPEGWWARYSFAAFTTDELLGLSPPDTEIYKTTEKYEAGFKNMNPGPRWFSLADTPPEALGNLLLTLIKDGVVQREGDMTTPTHNSLAAAEGLWKSFAGFHSCSLGCSVCKRYAVKAATLLDQKLTELAQGMMDAVPEIDPFDHGSRAGEGWDAARSTLLSYLKERGIEVK